MSKEAMKLALEALKQIDEAMPFPVAKLAQAALQEALAEQPAQQEPYPLEEMQEEILRLSEIISTNAFYQAGHANALEWAAEMAILEDPRTSDWVYDDPHELAKALRKGPDFPSSQQPTQQEPVAWMYVNTDGECEQIEYGEPFDDPSVTPLYKFPPAQRKPQEFVCSTELCHYRKPLSDEEIDELWRALPPDTLLSDELNAFARAIEAKLKEKNT